jgi:hypothetical protein
MTGVHWLLAHCSVLKVRAELLPSSNFWTDKKAVGASRRPLA